MLPSNLRSGLVSSGAYSFGTVSLGINDRDVLSINPVLLVWVLTLEDVVLKVVLITCGEIPIVEVMLTIRIGDVTVTEDECLEGSLWNTHLNLGTELDGTN
jgi:hypothetical protein